MAVTNGCIRKSDGSLRNRALDLVVPEDNLYARVGGSGATFSGVGAGFLAINAGSATAVNGVSFTKVGDAVIQPGLGLNTLSERGAVHASVLKFPLDALDAFHLEARLGVAPDVLGRRHITSYIGGVAPWSICVFEFAIHRAVFNPVDITDSPASLLNGVNAFSTCDTINLAISDEAARAIAWPSVMGVDYGLLARGARSITTAARMGAGGPRGLLSDMALGAIGGARGGRLRGQRSWGGSG